MFDDVQTVCAAPVSHSLSFDIEELASPPLKREYLHLSHTQRRIAKYWFRHVHALGRE